MKQIKTTKIEKNRLSASPSVLLVSLILSLTIILPNVHAQQQKSELSLADVIMALRSNKVTLAERNEILTDAIGERGITFTVTPEIEKELENTGANRILIDAIRKKGVIVKVASATDTKPSAPVNPAPPELDFAYYKKAADENFAKGELDAALTNYNKAVELNPENFTVYINRGLTFFKKKDYKSAIADYDKAIEINSGEVIAFSNRANAYEKIGDTEKAVEDYKKILELDKGNATAITALKKIEDEKTKAAEKQKEQEDALAEAEKEKIRKETEAKEKEAAEAKIPDAPQIIDLGRIASSMATDMVKPAYSDIAKSMNLQGQITVKVLIDEKGNVTSAESSSVGHRILRDAAEKAARQSKFKPAMFGDKAVKAKGYIVYNFVR